MISPDLTAAMGAVGELGHVIVGQCDLDPPCWRCVAISGIEREIRLCALRYAQMICERCDCNPGCHESLADIEAQLARETVDARR